MTKELEKSKYPAHELLESRLKLTEAINIPCINQGFSEQTIKEVVAEFQALQAQLAKYERFVEIIPDDYKPQVGDVVTFKQKDLGVWVYREIKKVSGKFAEWDNDGWVGFGEIKLLSVIRLANGKFAIKQSEMGE